MGAIRAPALIVICLSCVAVGKLGKPGGPLKMPRKPVDIFEVALWPTGLIAGTDAHARCEGSLSAVAATRLLFQGNAPNLRYIEGCLENRYNRAPAATLTEPRLPGNITSIPSAGYFSGLGGTDQRPMFKFFIFVVPAIAKFEYAVAISDSNNDTIFQCLVAKRTYFDAEEKRAACTFFCRLQDPISKDAIIYYTRDNDNGAVSDLELEGEGDQCVLGARLEVTDNIPQDCIDQFADTCGLIVPPHSRDLCCDREGDY